MSAQQQFDLQTHLMAMETRIREDIAVLRLDVHETTIDQAKQGERIKALEEKAGWIFAGIGTSIVGLCAITVAWVRSKLGV